jgi:hypothetical protein
VRAYLLGEHEDAIIRDRLDAAHGGVMRWADAPSGWSARFRQPWLKSDRYIGKYLRGRADMTVWQRLHPAFANRHHAGTALQLTQLVLSDATAGDHYGREAAAKTEIDDLHARKELVRAIGAMMVDAGDRAQALQTAETWPSHVSVPGTLQHLSVHGNKA